MGSSDRGRGVRQALRIVLNPGIYVGVLAVALLILVAYQARPSYEVTFGGPTDGPLLRGFNTAEVAGGPTPTTFRWTRGDSWIVLQDVGQQDFDMVLSANGWRPPGQPPARLRIEAGGKTLLDTAPAPAPADYRFSVPRDAVHSGTLVLHLVSNAFIPPNDPNPRPLGVSVTRLKVTPGTAPERFIAPPADIWGWLVVAAGLLGLTLSLLGWGVGGIALGTSLVGVLAAWLLVLDRLWLTSQGWYVTWPQSVSVAILVVLLLWLVGGWLLRLGGMRWSPWQRRAFLTMLMLAFAVRLAGELHPQIFIVDLVFHQHRLHQVETGQLLFTIKSAEWGGHDTFYLPTAYVFMLPFRWLFTDQLTHIKLFNVALGALGAFPVFYLARKAMDDGRAGLIASALYLMLPIAVLPLSWGVTSNLFGEFFALCSLAIAVGAYPNIRPNRPAFWALLFTLLIALLSHPGVVQLTGVAFAFISLLWLVSRRIIAARRGAVWTLASLASAAVLAYMFYYSHFAADMINTLQQIQAERAAQAKPGVLHLKIGGSVADASLGLVVRYVDNWRDWFLGGLRGFWQEAQAYYCVWPLPAAILGYVLIWPPFTREASISRSFRILHSAFRIWNIPHSAFRTCLVLAAVGWALAVVIFAVAGWLLNLYVRYSLFALPVVALGAGILLSGTWRKCRYGPLLTMMLVLLFAVQALALWQYRITYAFK